jgi:hypothetical protein
MRARWPPYHCDNPDVYNLYATQIAPSLGYALLYVNDHPEKKLSLWDGLMNEYWVDSFGIETYFLPTGDAIPYFNISNLAGGAFRPVGTWYVHRFVICCVCIASLTALFSFFSLLRCAQGMARNGGEGEKKRS